MCAKGEKDETKRDEISRGNESGCLIEGNVTRLWECVGEN